MTEATTADVTELQTQLTALETDHASLKTANAALTEQVKNLTGQIAVLTDAANGATGTFTHEEIVAMINSINTELGNVQGDTGSNGDATQGADAEKADPAPEPVAS